jgi:hypothetical protein
MLSSYPLHREFMNKILHAPVRVDQWQLEKLALVTADRRVSFFVPGLPTKYWTSLWGPAYHSLKAALDAFFAGSPEGASIGIIPDGPYVLAKAKRQDMSVTHQ